MTDYDRTLRLTADEMYNLGAEGSDKDFCTFDFSYISIDDYKGFFNTLPNMIYKKCISLRLCNDFEKSLERNLHKDTVNSEEDSQLNKRIDQDIKTFEYSIRFKKPGYSNYLAKIVGKALPRTKLLTSLEFDQIPFSGESFRIVTNAIKKARILRSITFANMTIEDKDFIYFLENISPFRLDRISFINCHITGESYEALKEYVNRKPSVKEQNQGRQFAKLILKGNGIKYNQKTGEVKRRFSPEDSIKERDIVTFNVNWIEEDPDENNENPNLQNIYVLRNIRNIVDTIKPASPTNDLRRQNESLKRELEELIFAIKAVKYSDDVFFIGENAEAYIKKIRAAEKVIEDYEAKHGEIIL